MFRCHGNLFCLILSILLTVIAESVEVNPFDDSQQPSTDGFIKLMRDGATQLDRLQDTVNSLLEDRINSDKRIKELEHQVTTLHRNEKEALTKLTDLEDTTQHLNERIKELRIDQLNNKKIIQATRRENRKLWKSVKKAAERENMEYSTYKDNTSGIEKEMPSRKGIDSVVMKNDELKVHEKVKISPPLSKSMCIYVVVL